MTKRVYGGGKHLFECWSGRLKITQYEITLAMRSGPITSFSKRWMEILKKDAHEAAAKCGCVSDDFPKKSVAQTSPSRSKISASKRLKPFFKGTKR